MASQVLCATGLDGYGFDSGAPAEADDLVSERSSTTGAGKQKAKADPKRRSKKADVVMLSSSFTCWRRVPETRLHLA